MFYSFFNFLGPFLVCRSFLAIFATFFWPNSITFSFLFSPFFSRSFRHFLISFLHFFNTILHLWCIFFSTFWHHLKPFDTFFGTYCKQFWIKKTSLDPCWLFWTHPHQGGPICCYLNLFGAIFSYFEVFGTYWSYSKLFGAIKSHLEAFLAIWSHLESFGGIWSHL